MTEPLHPPSRPAGTDDSSPQQPAVRAEAGQPPNGPATPAKPQDETTQILPPAPLSQPRDETTQILPPAPPAPAPVERPTSGTGAQAPETFDDLAHARTMILAAGEGGRAAAADTPGPGSSRPPQTLPGKRDTGEPEMRKVGRYQILERLGRGGMATVFKAHDPGIGRDVAIKFLHASLAEDDDCRVRFLREAGAAGRLSHPNIAVIHDVGEIDGRPYMAMELLTGLSLAQELEQKKTLPIREVVTIGIELARALDYAHGKGIVHRDIKPANILRMADSRSIKVTDFGIAHIENPSDPSTDRTRVGDILGTPQYMSPEQARGDKIDGRSDLFSAGIVLYQMLAGVRPFRGDSLVAVATRIANEDPTPVDKLREDVPPALRRVVDRCLAKSPANRFQTGAELAAALGKVLAEIDEAHAQKSRGRIVPLRVKWAATMALIVAVVMGITATVITQRQQSAMMGQVSDYGASLARFIAAQNAAAVLGEDWDAVDVAVQKMMETRNFERIVVIDLGGIVRVSSVPGQSGQRYAPAAAQTLARVGAEAATTRYVAGGARVLGFEAPITFQDKKVGQVALGIPEQPLTQVARLSITLMIVLAVVTVLAVAIAMYFVADRFAKPVRLLRDSMNEIAKGRFDHRIAEQRKDEFGELYQAFDSMAAALQSRQDGLGLPPASPSATDPAPAATAGKAPEGAAPGAA